MMKPAATTAAEVPLVAALVPVAYADGPSGGVCDNSGLLVTICAADGGRASGSSGSSDTSQRSRILDLGFMRIEMASRATATPEPLVKVLTRVPLGVLRPPRIRKVRDQTGQITLPTGLGGRRGRRGADIEGDLADHGAGHSHVDDLEAAMGSSVGRVRFQPCRSGERLAGGTRPGPPVGPGESQRQRSRGGADGAAATHAVAVGKRTSSPPGVGSRDATLPVQPKAARTCGSYHSELSSTTNRSDL